MLSETSSQLTFISIKKGDIAEVHSFGGMDGRVDKDGHAEIKIILDTVETNIDVRNTRMRQHLFQTNLHPYAVINADIPITDLRNMSIGARNNVNVDLDISLAGVSSTIEATLIVTRIANGKVLVETSTPILIHADEFDLMEGLETLQDLAKLPSITPIVPVSFSLVFTAQE